MSPFRFVLKSTTNTHRRAACVRHTNPHTPSVYKPPDELKVDYTESQKASKKWKECKEENFEFISRIFARSGISPTNTYLPPWINPVHSKQPRYDIDAAKEEAEMVMIGAVTELLEKTGAARASDVVLCRWLRCDSGWGRAEGSISLKHSQDTRHYTTTPQHHNHTHHNKARTRARWTSSSPTAPSTARRRRSRRCSSTTSSSARTCRATI
jgi:hypothetical protein